MNRGELRELAEDELLRLLMNAHAEVKRRGLTAEVIEVSPGNVMKSAPTPLVIRVMRKIPTLPPADVARIETLIDGWVTKRAGAAPAEERA